MNSRLLLNKESIVHTKKNVLRKQDGSSVEIKFNQDNPYENLNDITISSREREILGKLIPKKILYILGSHESIAIDAITKSSKMIITSKNSEGTDEVENMLKEIVSRGSHQDRNNQQTDSGDENSYGSLRDLRNKRLSDSRESPQFGCHSSNREGYQVSFKNDSAGINSNEELENALCQNNARIYQVIGGNNQLKPFQRQTALYTLNGSDMSSLISENSPQTNNIVAREVNESSKPSPQFLNPVKVLNNQATRHLSLSSSTSPFMNNLPQYAELVKMQNSQILQSESPQINPINNSRFEDQCPQYMKRKSAFIEKSHLSISSIYTGNSNNK